MTGQVLPEGQPHDGEEAEGGRAVATEEFLEETWEPIQWRILSRANLLWPVFGGDHWYCKENEGLGKLLSPHRV